MSKTKLMLGNAVEMSLIFQNPGPLSFGLGPHCFRGPVCSRRKKVSLFPWGYLKKIVLFFSFHTDRHKSFDIYSGRC